MACKNIPNRHKAKLEIPCPKCEGEGFVPLGDEHKAVLKYMRLGTSYTPAEVHKGLCEKVSIGAINNRLEDLRGWGFLDRVRDGKFHRYFKI